MKSWLLFALALAPSVWAQSELPTLKFGVGLFQPSIEKNDETYKPLADYLARELKRPVQLKTVDTWEGLAKSLATGETDMGLLGPWGYVLENNESGAEAIATILYDDKPEYFAHIITHPNSGITKLEQLKGKTFAFGDKGSTSGYLIPFHHFQKTFSIKEPEEFFGKVLYTKHQAIETQVTAGELDAGADYNRNRNAMIEQGLIDAKKSVIIWTSAPLPNDAFALSSDLMKDKKFVEQVRKALVNVKNELKKNPTLLPAHYTGFVKKDDAFYRPIKDAGLATGKLVPKVK